MYRFRRDGAFRAVISAVVFLSLASCAELGGEPAGGTTMQIGGANYVVRVVAGHFEIEGYDRPGLSSEELVGKVMVPGGANASDHIRIDAVERDTDDSAGEITLYDFRQLDQAGVATPICPTDAKGRTLGFPMTGTWSSDGSHLPSNSAFSIACQTSAEAKCVHLGYRPWRNAADGTKLWDYHETCTRLLRADYCGSGTQHMRDGVAVDMYDRIGIQHAEPGVGMTLEASWSPRGALCVRHVRVPTLISLKDLRTECATLPKDNLGESCDERPEALLYSRSADK
jgi:hypothetical protein